MDRLQQQYQRQHQIRQQQRYDNQLQQYNKQQDRIKRENQQMHKQLKRNQLIATTAATTTARTAREIAVLPICNSLIFPANSMNDRIPGTAKQVPVT